MSGSRNTSLAPSQGMLFRVAARPPSRLTSTAFLVAPLVLAWVVASFVPVKVELALHTVLEALYVAAAIAISSVAWHTPSATHPLRTTLAACLFLAVAVFKLLHFVTFPGMAGIGGAYAAESSFYFSRMAGFALPFALLNMVVAPYAATISVPGRLVVLGTSLLVMALLISYGLGPDFAVSVSAVASSASIALAHGANVALFLMTAFVAGRFGEMNRANTHHLVLAALLGALAEASLVFSEGGAGNVNLFGILGHAYGIFALVAAFVGIYGEAVRHPYIELENAHTTARLVGERHEDILSAINDGILCLDTRTRVLYANQVARRLMGMADTDAGKTPLSNAFSTLEGNGYGIIADVKTCLREGRGFGAVSYLRVADGGVEARAIEHFVKPLHSPSGDVTGAVLVLRDITPHRQLQQDLRAAADYVRNLFEASPDLLIAVGPDGIVTDANQAAEVTSGMDRHQLVGSHFVSCFTDTAEAREILRMALAGETVRDLPLVFARKGGGTLHVSCSIAPHRDSSGIRGAFAVVRDITDQHQTRLQLQFQADHDALTALPNRRQFREHVGQAIARSKRDEHSVAIMVVDLDDFKDINDTLGPAGGDELLKIVARRLADTLRETDSLARLGGDEFGILASGAALSREVQPLTERILAAISEPLCLGGRELSIRGSIGVSIHPFDADDPDTLLANADTAMHRAKENGKNACQYFKQEMNVALRRRVDLAHQLRGAMARNEFALHYQPQVNLGDDRIVGVEALLRWTNPELGIVSPADFIPVAEDTGLILPIGAWVVHEACRQTACWRKEYGIELRVAVNLSARQFRDPGLVAMVSEALLDTGLPPTLLELELTESMLMRDAGSAAATMEKLKALGAGLAIDDFGTGYSSLAYLKRFPIDKLKIDRSFVMDIPGDTNDTAIVRAILAMTHGLGLEVVAEGAETEAQMNFLRNHGCETVQGYFVSRPLPASDLPAFAERWGAANVTAESASLELESAFKGATP